MKTLLGKQAFGDVGVCVCVCERESKIERDLVEAGHSFYLTLKGPLE